MLRRPPRSTRTDTLFPYTTLFRSWPLKKIGFNNPLEIAPNPGWKKIIDYWLRGGPRPSAAEADQTLMRLATHRSEEHTSELQSLMRISYAVFCLKKKTENTKSKHPSKPQQLHKHDTHKS